MLKAIKKSLSFLSYLVCISLLLSIVLVYSVSPKTLLSPIFIALMLILIILSSVSLTYLANKQEPNKVSFRFFPNLSKKKRMLLFITSIATIVLVSVLVLIPKYITDTREQRLLEPALEQFPIEVIAEKQIDESRIRNTVIPLYKKLVELRESHDIQPIDYYKVYLYESVSDLQQESSRPDWVSAQVVFYTDKSPEIYLPLEEGGGFWTKTAETSNPAHEVTHIAVYEIIRPQRMGVIPRSYHEGIAQYESLKGNQNIISKFLIRLSALIYRDEMSNADNILYLEDLKDEKEVRQLYTLSYIFIDQLASKHEDTKLWDVIKLISVGRSFDESFYQIYGMSYSEYFNTFLESYLGT